MTAIVVLAKTPRAGAVKTRLCPPLTPASAAAFAAAALADTLDVVDALDWTARVLALDEPRPAWHRPGWTVVAQGAGTLDRRIGSAMLDADRVAGGGEPVLLVGMDTPHLGPDDLRLVRDALSSADAVLGPADDGGFWALGLRRADRRLTDGVAMSSAATGRAQLSRLTGAGLDVVVGPRYRDIDTIADAWAAVGRSPRARFARLLGDVTLAS